MKKVLCYALTLVVLLGVLPIFAGATENNEEIICFRDGSYATVEITITESRASGNKTGNKVYTYYNSDSVTQWEAVLSGTFTYTGSNASCTTSSMNVTIYDSSWYTISKSASKSGNRATGSATIGEKLNGVTVAKIPVNLTLSCDANGNLS